MTLPVLHAPVGYPGSICAREPIDPAKYFQFLVPLIEIISRRTGKPAACDALVTIGACTAGPDVLSQELVLMINENCKRSCGQ